MDAAWPSLTLGDTAPAAGNAALLSLFAPGDVEAASLTCSSLMSSLLLAEWTQAASSALVWPAGTKAVEPWNGTAGLAALKGLDKPDTAGKGEVTGGDTGNGELMGNEETAPPPAADIAIAVAAASGDPACGAVGDVERLLVLEDDLSAWAVKFEWLPFCR